VVCSREPPSSSAVANRRASSIELATLFGVLHKLCLSGAGLHSSMVSTRATKYTYEAPVKPASGKQRTKPPSSRQRAPKKAAPTPASDVHPLHDAGLLQRIIDYVGPGNFAYLCPVSMEWAIAAMSVEEHRLRNYSRFYKSFVLYDIGPRETLFSAVFASPATLRHAHTWGRLNLAEYESDWLERLAGRYASIETLKVAQELGMSFTLCPYVVLGAAESGDIEKLRWLLDEQHCEVPPSLSKSAARSGSTAMLAWLKQRGVPLTGSAMGKAMAFGHTDAVRFLHAQGCPWSTTLCDEVRTTL
jgi:hypothetical protein